MVPEIYRDLSALVYWENEFTGFKALTSLRPTGLQNLFGVLQIVTTWPYFYWEGVQSTPSSFFSITQKRENIFSSNLLNFFIDKERRFLVAMVIAQIKGVQNDILKWKHFFQFWLQKWKQQLSIN